MRGHPKFTMIRTTWYHTSAFVRILETECALQLTGVAETMSIYMNKDTNSMSSVTGLNGGLYFWLGSKHPRFLGWKSYF